MLELAPWVVAVTVAGSSPAPHTAPTPAPAPAPAEKAAWVAPALQRAALCAELSQTADALRQERAKLDKDKQELVSLTRALEELRGELLAEVKRLEALQALPTPGPASGAEAAALPPASVGGGKDEARDVSLATLAKTLRSMRSEQAAQLVAKLDPELAVDLLRRMRPGDSGALLGKMKPEQAAALLAKMSTAMAEDPR